MRSQKRPCIGVTGPDQGHWPSWFFIWVSLWLAGARMLRLRPNKPHYGTRIDGLIISGGTDVDPARYAKQRKPHYPYDEARDQLEISWLQQAESQRLPILGICRGAQLLNVVRGGSLYMDIKLVCETAQYPGNFLSKIIARKTVRIKQDSRLHHIFRAHLTRVNSLHRQSIDRLGDGLVVTAWEENSIVQAVELTDSAGLFLLGVQWHPEFMPQNKRQRRLFRQFVKQARQ